ncbi:MAG TPA: uracil-DNA glycosylase family protein, partial [Anaerolineales bacterium]
MTLDTLVQLNLEIISCRKCPRLVDWREQVAREKRRAYRGVEYWGKPVPGFGDPNARVLVVGLAPGAHGSNRTGRQFTGDGSGGFLFPALFRAGFASQP